MFNFDISKVPGKSANAYARCGSCRKFLANKDGYFLIYSDGRKIFNNGYDSIECAKTHLKVFYSEQEYVLTYTGESEQETS